MPLKKNIEETFPVMLCHYMDKGDTDTFSIKIKNKTKQKRVYIKKKKHSRFAYWSLTQNNRISDSQGNLYFITWTSFIRT